MVSASTHGVPTLRWRHPRLRSSSQQAIHFSVAPVFLLTGIAGLLGGMVSGLARIIIRVRNVAGAPLSSSTASRDRFAC
ncbi:hypothetical protein RCH10_004893 [Variovorax sp. GrIS 2.14]